jgi:hypothetical protein
MSSSPLGLEPGFVRHGCILNSRTRTRTSRSALFTPTNQILLQPKTNARLGWQPGSPPIHPATDFGYNNTQNWTFGKPG